MRVFETRTWPIWKRTTQTLLYVKSKKKPHSLTTHYLCIRENDNSKIYMYLAVFLKMLPPGGPFRSNSFFRPKTMSKVAFKKTKSATHFSLLLLSSSSLFLSLLLFPLLAWFWSLSGPKNLPFDAFPLKGRQISLGWPSKKSARYTLRETVSDRFRAECWALDYVFLWSRDLLG